MVNSLKGGKKMNNRIIIAIVIIGILAVGGYLLFNAGAEVSAQGVSSITATPDRVSVYLSLQSRADTAEAAKNGLDTIHDKTLTELVKLGLERKEIQTANYNIYPDYDYTGGNPKIKGYVASEDIVIKLDKFDKVASIVDAAVDSGSLVSSINFELSQEKQNEYKAQALKLAGEDARAKAEATAEGFGKHLGRLVSVNSQNFYYPGPIAYYAKGGEAGVASASDISAVREAAMNIAPKDLEVTASIDARYKLSLF